MDHDLDGIPPFSSNGEELANDFAFLKTCLSELDVVLKDIPGVQVLKPHISRNELFGLVLRADFQTDYDRPTSVNRIMFWRLPDGNIASFFGLDIPTLPISDT